MNQAGLEINELLRISQRVLNYGEPPGFRTVNVFCRARTGETIRFASPDQIQGQLVSLMSKFQTMTSRCQDINDYARAFSVFWLGFIAIHPFINGNGRTGKEYLLKKANEKGLILNRPELLDGILLLGDLPRDLSLLQIYFKSNLSYKRTNP